MSDVLKKEYIKIDFEVSDKDDALEKISILAEKLGITRDAKQFLEGLLLREDEFSTGVGQGVAIPHCRCECVKCPSILILKLKDEIDWSSIDDGKVIILIVLATPLVSKNNDHLTLLSQIARKMVDEEFVEKIKLMTDANRIYQLFSDVELKKE